jgi:plastocyanin
MRLGSIALALCAVPVMLTGCTSDGVAAVAVKGFRFQPATLEVPAGTTVAWTNRDNTLHTITAGVPESKSGLFEDTLGQDERFAHSFARRATVAYFCAIHDSMRGTVRVS